MTVQLPRMQGRIERRLLVNYRVDPDALRRVLPEPFRPWLVGDAGIAGICLIRLGALRPAGFPAGAGVTTENAAHRIAVEWDCAEDVQRGVYIPRRDSSSRLTQLVGGRLFPGLHHHATFEVFEDEGRYDVAFTSDDGSVRVAVSVREASEMPERSVFKSLPEASAFFRQGSLGYSATRDSTCSDGLELQCDSWNATPAIVDHAESSYFDDLDRFPPGSAVLDSALLVRDLDVSWRAHESLRTSPRVAVRS